MIDLLLWPCGQLLTMAGGSRAPKRGAQLQDVGLVAEGCVGIDLAAGSIEFAGRRSDLPAGLVREYCSTVDASSCVVLPGLVDSHTHLVFAGSRADEFYRRAQGESYQQIAAAGGGIFKTVEATRAASEDELFLTCVMRLRELARSGTTTVEIKTGYGLNVETERKCLRVIERARAFWNGIIMTTYMGAHAVPPEHATTRDGYVAEVCSELKRIADTGKADFYDIFVDPLGFSQEEAELIIAEAAGSALGLKLHGDEFGDDGTAAWAAGKRAVSIDHLGGIGADGIAALAASETIATLLPATMFFSGHGRYAPARTMIEAGCAVALASDLNPGSSLVYSLLLVMTLAALQMRMSAEECLNAATINAAHALGLADMIGSLEPGKRADLIVLDVPDYREAACHVGRDIVRDVLIRGRFVKRGGTLSIPQPEL